MSNRIEDTQDIRIKRDDDSLDRLIEYKGAGNMAKNARRTKKRRRKSKTPLTILITALGFALVFVIFFVASYMFFTVEPVKETTAQETQEKQDGTQNDVLYEEDNTVEDEDVLERPATVSHEDEDVLSSEEEKPEEEAEEPEEQVPASKPQASKPQATKPQTNKPAAETTKPSTPSQTEPTVNSGGTSEGVILE